MYHNYPTRQPVLVRDSDLRIERRLPVQGEVKVRPGDRVEPSTIIAVGDQTGRPIVLNLARELEVEPEKVAELLTVKPGSAVAAGDTIARKRRVLRAQSVKSPVAGIFTRLDPQAGTATIVPAARRIELAAYVAGVVEDVEQAYGATIRAFGSRFYGAFGVGDEAFGVLKVVTKDRQHPLSPDLIDSRAARSVLVAGGAANAAALRKAAQVGAKGVIIGSIEERELAAFLKTESQALWRVGLPDWRLPAATSPLTIVVTEGFGQSPMAQPLYDTLVAGDSEQVSLCGLTRIANTLSRPEVLVSSGSGRDQEEGGLPIAALVPGATVRIIDQDHLGAVGTISEAPRRRRLGGDLVVEALEVDLPNGGRMVLPVANVEVLA